MERRSSFSRSLRTQTSTERSRGAVGDVPDALLQLVAVEHTARLAREREQQPELRGCQLGIEALAGGVEQERPPPCRVDQQAGHADRLERLAALRRRARAAQQRLDAGDELAHAERLREVVVGADLERVHLVVLGAARRDDQDRRRDALPARLLRECPAVDAGQHEIDDRDVVLLVAKLPEALVAVLRNDDVESGVSQVRRNGTCDHAVVLDHEHARHGQSVPRPSVAGNRAMRAVIYTGPRRGRAMRVRGAW